MNEMELLNEPVEFTLGSETFELRKISTAKKRAIVQSWYVKQQMNEIKTKAEIFDDKGDRNEYITAQLDKIPSGQALIDAVNEVEVNADLIVKYFIECATSDYTTVQVEKMFEDATQAEADMVVVFIHGSGKKKSSSTKKGGKKSSASSRKKGTRRKK